MSTLERPIEISDRRKLNIPLAFLITILAGTAVSYASWVTTADKVEAQGRAIIVLEAEARVTREILIRIDENMKDLRRERYRSTP